jgi:hypothetical protein
MNRVLRFDPTNNLFEVALIAQPDFVFMNGPVTPNDESGRDSRTTTPFRSWLRFGAERPRVTAGRQHPVPNMRTSLAPCDGYLPV